MKQKLLTPLTAVSCVLLCIMSMVGMILSVGVIRLNGFSNSKPGLILLILALLCAGTVGIALLQRYDAENSCRDEKHHLQQELNTANAKAAQQELIIREQSAKLEHCAQMPPNLEALQKKCDAIEAFRNSFPCRINDNLTLYNLIRTEITVSSHSRWLAIGEYNGELWRCSVLRPDTQSHKEMLMLAYGAHSPQDIQELDQSADLMWN